MNPNKLIVSFDKMRDIPILNYDGKLYTKKVFNYDEIRTLYVILQANIEGLKYKNLFFENLLKSKGGTVGKMLAITAIKENVDDTSLEIIYFKSRSKTYYFHFDNLEYRTNFNKELRDFYNSSNIYLYKDIKLIVQGDYGHKNFVLIKKDEKKELQIFFFEPNNTINDSGILEKVENFLKEEITELGYPHKFFNLTNFYGIQNLETNNGNLEEELTSIRNKYTFHFTSVVKAFNNFLHFITPYNYHLLKETQSDNMLTVKFLKNHFMKLYFDKIFKDHMLYPLINSFVEDIATNSVNDEIKFFENFNIDEQFNLFMKDFQVIDFKIIKNLENIIKEKFKLQNERNNIYNYDFFNGNCNIWSYYAMTLIIMNPDINPFEIIKASYFQTNDLSKMNKIFEETKQENKDKRNYKEQIEIFRNDFLEILKEKNAIFKRKLETDDFDKGFFDATRILYIKITNLIILNIIYNRLQNKYLLFSIQEDCKQELCVKKMVPEKVNELLNKFTILNIPLTNDNILSLVLEGKPIENLNHLILLDKEPLTKDFEEGPEDFVFQEVFLRNKYLKYKSKYLNFKKKLLSNK
jgi:hypothetical protein